MAGLKLLKGSKTQETRLKEVIALARTTPTGREILKKMKELSSRTGNYPVVFSSLGKNLGQYDYTSQTLELNRQFLNEDTRLSVSTLIHEMTHILQHSKNIPAESLEMEERSPMERRNLKPDFLYRDWQALEFEETGETKNAMALGLPQKMNAPKAPMAAGKRG